MRDNDNQNNPENNNRLDQDQPEIGFPTREELENQLTVLENKVEECKNSVLRAHAEAENVRRRSERDVANAHKFGIERLVNDLLPVLDSLTRGLEGSVARDSHSHAMREGIQLTLTMLEKTLEKHGVQVIAPKRGDAFNPDMHHAVSVQADPDVRSNTVLELMQKGYALNGRVLRAAMVILSS